MTHRRLSMGQAAKRAKYLLQINRPFANLCHCYDDDVNYPFLIFTLSSGGTRLTGDPIPNSPTQNPALTCLVNRNREVQRIRTVLQGCKIASSEAGNGNNAD